MFAIQLECHLQELAAGLSYSPGISNSFTHDLHQRTKVVIWLYDNIDMRIEGRIVVRVLYPVRTHSALNHVSTGRLSSDLRFHPPIDTLHLRGSHAHSLLLHPPLLTIPTNCNIDRDSTNS